jgi:hypothetical protein
MKKALSLILMMFLLIAIVCGCAESEDASSAISNEESVSTEISETADSKDITEEPSVPEDSSDGEDSSIADAESDSFEESLSALEFPQGSAPENIIYNTPSTIEKERYYGSLYPAPDLPLIYATTPSKKDGNLEKLVKENLGNDDVWFYVALRANDLRITTHETIGPNNKDDLIDQIEGAQRLLDLGMIPNYEHIWSYSLNAKEWPNKPGPMPYSIIGYMTADMINELTDTSKIDGYTYWILHLPEDKYFEEYFTDYDFNIVVISSGILTNG